MYAVSMHIILYSIYPDQLLSPYYLTYMVYSTMYCQVCGVQTIRCNPHPEEFLRFCRFSIGVLVRGEEGGCGRGLEVWLTDINWG
jgi:hypothetical protein